MHAQPILLSFLEEECPSMHAKRRQALAVMTDAAEPGGLSLIKMSIRVDSETSLRHCIKRVDRLLSNVHLWEERTTVYGALARRVLQDKTHVAIIVDWSDLLTDVSQHVLRASVAVKGRAIVIYEEIHPTKKLANAAVHRKFMVKLRSLLPAQCQPVIITDAGYRATWFKMLDKLKFAWIGRIRNRDMIRCSDGAGWQGGKELYAGAKGRARDLGRCEYARTNPVQCRLVLIKKSPKGRQCKTAFGDKTSSCKSGKHQAAQSEPWLLTVSLNLCGLSADAIVNLYGRRMQIEQTFRDIKNPQWGMGLRESQTRKPKRLAILLLIGALLGFALWLIGLAARATGYAVHYGSKKNAPTTLSILSLARRWLLGKNSRALTRRQILDALTELRSMVFSYEI